MSSSHHLADRPRFRRHFCLAGLHFAMSLFQRSSWSALSEDPWLDPVCCHQVIRIVCCAHYVINPRLWLIFYCFVVLWHTAEEGVAVNVVAVLLLIVGVFGFVVGVVDACCVRGGITLCDFSLRLYNHLQHFSFRCFQVPEALRSDGVTVASNSFTLPFTWHLGVVN